ncbi:MAG: orotidine 5'-phosphate decarboxylase / HUMPS family protein [Egibacteraceae bacterium]
MVDDNWHVRGCVLHGILSGDADSVATSILAGTAASVLTSDASWRQCPAHIAPLAQRLLLLHGAPPSEGAASARQHALFMLLRESRTGWTRLPEAIQKTLVAEGCGLGHWLARHEALAIQERDNQFEPGILLRDPALRRETFRRLRDRRSVQVALDLHDLDQAIMVAAAAAAAGTDFIEVGDPLIKTVGLAAVERIKRTVPHTAVVAEMMSADWGRDQVELAAAAGADVVLLIGPATVASVTAAVDAGRRLGVPILLDVPAEHATEWWVRDMERVGVDGLAITTNIDLGVRGRHPLEKARAIRNWTRLPVAVSGGFGPTDYAICTGGDWDILIIGRSITDAVEPVAVANRLVDLVHRRRAGEIHDHKPP